MCRTSVKHTLLLVLLGLFTLAMVACESEGDSAGRSTQGRTLPERSAEIEGKRLSPGEYVSDEFRPAMSFRLVEKGWQTGTEHYNRTGHSHRRLKAHGESVEMSDYLTLSYAPEGELAGTLDFLVDPRVYRVVSSYEAREEPTPEDMVAWLRQNSNLNVGEPEPVTVGGENGIRFEATPSRVPEDYITCGYPCVPLFQTSDLNLFYDVGRSEKVRFLVLNDVGGKTVTIAIKAEADRFDEFAPTAQHVLDTVEWTGG